MDKLLSQLLFALALIGATCQAYSDKAGHVGAWGL